MSVTIMARVWEHSPQKGGDLLVLLALADYANDQGICWPDQETLAAKARLTDRQLRRVLQELERQGEILIHPGRGRGHHAVYCVLSGLSPQEQARKRTLFPDIISGIIVHFSRKKRTFSTIKEDIYGREKRTFMVSSDADLEGQDASNGTLIHHGIHHDPPPPPQPAGGGGGEEEQEGQEEPTTTEQWLLREGFSVGAAREFRTLDLAACQADLKRARAGGTQIGGVVKRWRKAPPQPPQQPVAGGGGGGPPPRPPSILAGAPSVEETRAMARKLLARNGQPDGKDSPP